MKIFKNIYAGREAYFMRVRDEGTDKRGEPRSGGYLLEKVDGNWRCRWRLFSDKTLGEMPVVANLKMSTHDIIGKAILEAVKEKRSEKKKEELPKEV